jgi:hypothetical protein
MVKLKLLFYFIVASKTNSGYDLARAVKSVLFLKLERYSPTATENDITLENFTPDPCYAV